ncbi:MAG: Ig domain-containing protein [Planctomycetes bacterium]|nr:Ig domain-containing protein [Planctomycetota bacterium]
MRVWALVWFLVVATVAGGDDALHPWSTDTHPTDVARSHVEEIVAPAGGMLRYTVVQGGTMDGRHGRLPMGCGVAREGALLQTWESNRSVRMENIGDADLVNPWLSNGRNNFRSVAEIVAAAVTPDMTDADKAFALWFQEIQYRHHSPGDNRELGDPVKVFNVYGYNTCGNDSISLAALWRQAGLRVAPARALGHCISQVFYDDAWHFYDGDMHSVYLLRDNRTVAGEQDIVRDHDLIKRTHSKGILFLDTWWSEPEMCSMYFYEGPVAGERAGKADTTMNMVLRPGEALVWRWGQVRPVKYHGALQTTPTYTDVIYNGLWEYCPDFSTALWRKGATTIENVTMGPDGLAADAGKMGTIVWTMRSPYVFVGGRLEVEGAGARFFLCQEGRTWRPAPDNLDRLFPIVGPACYEYQLKCQLEGTACLRRLTMVNDVQMAPLALPEMVVGENTFTYSDQSVGDRKVRITHHWVERSASRPPAAPAGAVYPPDGGEANGTDVVFQWTAPADPDGDAIADYQFELSPRADMKWPLSLSFYKLISRTADAIREKDKATGKEKVTVPPRYTVPQPGLLTPDCLYYWRVRARDDRGLWGPWSQTLSFTPRGPAYPLGVTVDFDEARGVGMLRWKANPAGRAPGKYRVYGSDEKGFTIADQRHQGVVGASKKEMSDWVPWFPANFLAETTTTELAVLGGNVDLPTANTTYYRVVAVDAQGKRSGPSDYATAPRPVIYSKPVTTAHVGTEYRFQVLANRSLGDLSARMVEGRQTSGYFDIERPRFTLAEGPAWLRIDTATGLLSGTPDAAGRAEVTVTVAIDRQVRRLDEAVLRWGNEKVLSVDTERIGTATQKFVIDVTP